MLAIINPHFLDRVQVLIIMVVVVEVEVVSHPSLAQAQIAIEFFLPCSIGTLEVMWVKGDVMPVETLDPNPRNCQHGPTPLYVLLFSSQDTLPDGDDRAMLQIAGLGERKISLLVNSDAREIYDELLNNFPRLSEAGGFELLRVPE